MGGFTCFDLDIGRQNWSKTHEIHFGRAYNFSWSTSPDLIPDLSLTSITDRSNSKQHGKGFVVRQVGWFCLNSASRLGERLPLSLLEVSTLAHGLCTLASYAAWWYKPLNIDEPTWIRMSSERAREALRLCKFSIAMGMKITIDFSEQFRTNIFFLSTSTLRDYH